MPLYLDEIYFDFNAVVRLEPHAAGPVEDLASRGAFDPPDHSPEHSFHSTNVQPVTTARRRG